MKKFFVWMMWMCCCIFVSNAQDPGVLNKYRSVFLPPLYYEKARNDIYGIRQTVIEKLSASGVPVFPDEQSIPSSTMKNPCSMLRCHVNNSTPRNEKNVSIVSVLFFNCSNDTVLNYSARANLFFAFNDTRNSFIRATQKALEPLNDYHYQFAESPADMVQPANDGADSIEWIPGKKLVWDDFKGEAMDGDPADALTYTANATLFESFGVGNRFEVKSHVTCFFIKSKSWVKAAKKSDDLLNHEQRHFDLAEVCSREFRKKLEKIQFTKENFQEEVTRVNREMNEKNHRLQQQYDDETDHSRLEEKQKEWNLKIDKMLKDSETER